MRVVGLIGLVLALLVVGVLAKKQMSAALTPAVPAMPPGATAPAGDVRTQSRQIQEQIKQSLDAAQQRRPMPDDN